MPLTSFGAILSFAETMEQQDAALYRAASATVESLPCADYAKEAEKNVKLIQRLRRECVTEMILEPITGFERAPYVVETGEPETMDAAALVATAKDFSARSVAFYTTAAEKLTALPELARALKRLGKKHAERQAAMG